MEMLAQMIIPDETRNLADTLSHRTASTRRQESMVRPISQVVLQIEKVNDSLVFEETRQTILEWMSRRPGIHLPSKAWNGQSFTLEDIGAQRAEAVAIETPHYWGARLDDADKSVAQRVWATEIGIAEDQESVLFGARLQCVTHGENISFQPSVPTFVRAVILTQVTRLDGRVASVEPWLVDSTESVDELFALLINPRRRSEVFVFSLPESSIDPQETAASALDVAKNVAGVAHVAIITGPASYFLSDLMGKEFSVFQQAVRTYRPGLNPSIDSPYNHPLALARRIAEWDGEGPSAYQQFIISQALRRTVSGSDVRQRLPPFTEVRSFASELRRRTEREAGSSDKELLSMAEEEIGRLEEDRKKDRQESDEIVGIAETEKEEALQASQQMRALNLHLKYRIQELERRLEDAGRSTQPEIPSDLDDLENWCHANMSGSVELHNRAYQGAKKSQYGDPSFIFEVLLLLRDNYVPMKTEGGIERKTAFEEACRNLSITEAPSFSGSRWGEEGDAYLVNYAGRKRRLERHLTKGSSRDEQTCFRLYFFWDDDSQQVVVGWLPSHLNTRIT